MSTTRNPTKTEQYAQHVLDELNARAELNAFSQQTWIGNFTALINEVEPKGHLGHISKILQASNAITMVNAGAGGRPSEVRVNRQLIFETDDGEPIDFDVSSTNATPTQQLQQQMRVMNSRLQTVENQLAVVLQYLQTLQRTEFAEEAMQSYGPPKEEPYKEDDISDWRRRLVDPPQ